MTRSEFSRTYPNIVEDSHRSAIFEERKSLLVKLLLQGSPIYIDRHYYGSPEDTDRFEEVTPDNTEYVSKWRECHYYTLYTDGQGNSAWILTGGRYD